MKNVVLGLVVLAMGAGVFAAPRIAQDPTYHVAAAAAVAVARIAVILRAQGRS